MHRKYIVACYQDEAGNVPFIDYLCDLNETDLAVIQAVLERLQFIGLAINDTRMGHRIEGPINQLRKDRHRILYGVDENYFILLCAFLKKTEKTPEDQVLLAQKRFDEYKRTKRCYPLTILSN